jgi:hypothetical protein
MWHSFFHSLVLGLARWVKKNFYSYPNMESLALLPLWPFDGAIWYLVPHETSYILFIMLPNIGQSPCNQPYFYLKIFIRKWNTKFKNFKWSDFGAFESPNLRGKKMHQIYIFILQCVAINIEGWLKICTSYLDYTQIWLNLLNEDGHFLISSYGWSSFKLHLKLLTKTLLANLQRNILPYSILQCGGPRKVFSLVLSLNFFQRSWCKVRMQLASNIAL